MSKLKHLIYTKILGALPAVEQKRAAFYKALVFILLRVPESLDKTRVIATAAEIDKLLDIGQTMNHEVDDCILIVKPRTYENRLRRRRNNKPIKRPGRSVPDWHFFKKSAGTPGSRKNLRGDFCELLENCGSSTSNSPEAQF